MRKAIAIFLLLLISVQVWAFSYPETLYGLFQKYRDLGSTLHIVTLYIGAHKTVYRVGDPVVAACKEYVGQVLVAAGDYITFKATDGDVVIIPYTAIVEVTEE